MTKYEYMLDDKTGLITKNIVTVYPDINKVEKEISFNKGIKKNKEDYIKALEGVGESRIIAIEERWYDAYKELETVKLELKDLEDKLSKNDDLLKDTDKESNDASDISEIEVKDTPLTDDELKDINTRITVLKGKEDKGYDPYGNEVINAIDGLITVKEKVVLDIESANGWLKAYRGLDTNVTRPILNNDLTISKKFLNELIKNERDATIRTSDDSIADVAKMVSLSFSIISELWKELPDANKDNVDNDKRDVIEYAIEKFNTIQTRADRQLSKEGTNLVDKLFDREVAIADVIDNINKDIK